MPLYFISFKIMVVLPLLVYQSILNSNMTDNIILRALKLSHSNLQYCIYIYTQIIHFDAHTNFFFMAMHLESIFPNRLKQITYVVFLKIISTNNHKT